GHRRATIWGRLEVIRIDFDEIGSVFELYPHLLASFPWRIHKMEVTRAHGRSPHAFRRDDHTRAWDDAFVDGIAKVYIRRPAARQIARRGKARLKVQPRVLRSQERDVWRGKRRSGLNDERH